MCLSHSSFVVVAFALLSMTSGLNEVRVHHRTSEMLLRARPPLPPTALSPTATLSSSYPPPPPPPTFTQTSQLGLNAGYAHRRRVQANVPSPEDAAAAFVNVCVGDLGTPSSTIALIDTSDGGTLTSPAYVTMQPGVAYVVTFAASADFALASFELALAAPGGAAEPAASLSISFAEAGGGTPIWAGSMPLALNAAAAFVTLPFGADAVGGGSGGGDAYALTMRVSGGLAQWSFGQALATAGVGAEPRLTVAVDGGATSEAAFMPGLLLLATLTGGETCMPVRAPTAQQASPAALAIFSATGAVAAAVVPDCSTDGALVFLDSIEAGRFVSQAGVAVPANAVHALVMPWACTGCIVHLSELVLPIAGTCGISPVTLVINVGHWTAGAFVQSAAEASSPLFATLDVGPLAQAFTLVPPDAWTLTAPDAASVGTSALAITITASACVTWGSGIAGAAPAGTQLLVASAAAPDNFAASAELGGATVLAWTTPADTCPAVPAPPAPGVSPSSTRAASPAAVPASASSSPTAAAPVVPNFNSNSAGEGGSNTGLAGGAVAGVVIGCVVGAAALVFAGAAIMARARRPSAASAATSPPA